MAPEGGLYEEREGRRSWNLAKFGISTSLTPYSPGLSGEDCHTSTPNCHSLIALSLREAFPILPAALTRKPTGAMPLWTVLDFTANPTFDGHSQFSWGSGLGGR